LQPALVAGYIEMTLSEKPNSRLQKYRLTEKGFNILQSLELKYMKALNVEAKVL
jgi:ATP-dependent DNA helicase RecG